jgi:hypothetical protein
MNEQELLKLLEFVAGQLSIILPALRDRLSPGQGCELPADTAIALPLSQPKESQPLAEKIAHGLIIYRANYSKKDLIMWQPRNEGSRLIARIVAVLGDGSYEISVKNTQGTRIIPVDQIVGLYIPD